MWNGSLLLTTKKWSSETTIHGAVAWCHGDEVIHSFGGNVLCYGRSMMKPFMLKSFHKRIEDFTWEQKAIAVASHNGDTEHVAAAQSLLTEAEWPLMLTPVDVPLIQFDDRSEGQEDGITPVAVSTQQFLRDVKSKDGTGRLHSAYSPCVRGIHGATQRFLGEDWSPLRIAKDGCGLPTVSNTVSELAKYTLASFVTRMQIGYGRLCVSTQTWWVVSIALTHDTENW